MLCKSKSFDTKLCIAGVLAVQDQLRKSIVVFLKLTSDLRAMMLHGHMHWAMSGRPLNVAPQDCMHALHLSECNCDESLSLTLKLQDFKSMFGMVLASGCWLLAAGGGCCWLLAAASCRRLVGGGALLKKKKKRVRRASASNAASKRRRGARRWWRAIAQVDVRGWWWWLLLLLALAGCLVVY